MTTVIIDIETAPLPLSPEQSAYLTRDCETDEERAAALDKASLYPLTGQVACVGMLNPETDNVRIFPSSMMMNESGVLSQFWDAVRNFARVVTFNGRNFDVPFLMMRSAILGVVPSRFDLLGYRYHHHPHCDLLDQLTHYGVTRKFSLDMYCRSLGIEASSTSGGEVAAWFAAGEHEKIAQHCEEDLRATAALYFKWLKGWGKE